MRIRGTFWLILRQMKPKDSIVACMSEEDRKTYHGYLITNSGEVLPDPYCVQEQHLSNNSTEKWPLLTFGDIQTYLLHRPSEFTHETLKAEAYNYFVSGHVQRCFYHEVKGTEFSYIRSLVLPGQQQNPKSDSDLYDAWFCVHQSWVKMNSLQLWRMLLRVEWIILMNQHLQKSKWHGKYWSV